ncbi:MAG: phospholipase D-like domain-containing protein, partial [Microcystaceae cyanobacterium]
TVDVAVQELRLPNIAKALVARYQAGVKVRVILENNYSRPWSDLSATEINQLDERDRDHYNEFIALVDTNQDGQLSLQEIHQRDALVILHQAGVALIDDTADGSQGSGLMHHKFIIVDGNILIVSSANFTTSDIHGDFKNLETRGNANNLLKINSPQLAKLFTEEFNLMWGDGPRGEFDSKFGVKKTVRPAQTVTLGKTTVTVHFSPISSQAAWQLSSNGLIGSTLNQATQAVDLALFVFSDQTLANVLENRHQKQVEIKALIDPEFAFRDYSEGLDMLGVSIHNNCRTEAHNHPWQVPITTVGIPQLAQGDKLHHKFGVVDKITVITGSHNWSAAANYDNDETVLVIKSSLIAAHYLREFNQLYRSAILGTSTQIQEKIQENKQGCPPLTSVSSTPVKNELVNVNTANQQELESLPGIGTKLAQRIIEA